MRGFWRLPVEANKAKLQMGSSAAPPPAGAPRRVAHAAGTRLAPRGVHSRLLILALLVLPRADGQQIEGPCVVQAGCHAILQVLADVPAIGTVPGYPTFGDYGEYKLQWASNPRSAQDCIAVCRAEMFSFALFRGGPVPAGGDDATPDLPVAVATDGRRRRLGEDVIFAGLCACSTNPLDDSSILVQCALGPMSEIVPLNLLDEGKGVGWLGAVYHAYSTDITDPACADLMTPAPAQAGSVAPLDSESDSEPEPEVTAAASSGQKSNNQMYDLVAAGAGSMLIAVGFFWAFKKTISGGRGSSGSGGRDDGGRGSGGGSSSGLADNPIFDLAVFLPSENNTGLSDSGSPTAADGVGGELPVAEAPPSFFCPITQDLMRDPVLIGDGHTYERSAIEQWLQGHSTSPMTNAPLDSRARNMVPNHTLRSMIVEFVEKYVAQNNPELEPQPEVDPAAGDVDGDEAFSNPLSDSAPEPADNDAPQTGATLPREAIEAAAPGATFDIEEAAPAGDITGGGRRRGRFGRRRPEEDAEAPREVEFAPAGDAAALPAAPPPAAPAWESVAQPFVGPYSIEEFDPELYSREDMQTVRTLLIQYANEGVTFNTIAQYNVTCPRRMAEDRRRRQVFRQQQMEAQARRAAAAAEEGGEAEPEPEAC